VTTITATSMSETPSPKMSMTDTSVDTQRATGYRSSRSRYVS